MDDKLKAFIVRKPLFFASTKFFLFVKAGGAAGFSVDLALYPLDTIKTRLQSPAGFFPSGS